MLIQSLSLISAIPKSNICSKFPQKTDQNVIHEW
jgi:hypothetical protein